MPNVRALVIMQGGSGLPEDRFLNTFHFAGGVASYDSVVDGIHPELSEFYNEASEGIGLRISQYASRSAEIRYYNLADAEPRVPRIESLTLPAPAVTTEVPEEVAAVLSLRGSAPVTARRRGRLYLGPLTTGVLTDGTTTTPTRLSSAFITAVTNRADALRQAIIGIDNGNVWAIRSTVPSENFVPIFGGWMDNAFDVQRRRGPDATTRTEWGIPL